MRSFCVSKKFVTFITFTLSFYAFQVCATTATSSLTVVQDASSQQKVGKFVIDHQHSSVGFEVAHLVVSSVEGKFKSFQGTFEFDPNDFSKTQVIATAKTDTVDTGEPKRDKHLMSADFFYAKKYPTLTFKSNSAKKTGDNTFDLMGDITIRGVTKPIVFKVTYRGMIDSGSKQTAAFKAEGQLNRKDFGLNFQSVVGKILKVGDDVTLKFLIEGIKK